MWIPTCTAIISQSIIYCSASCLDQNSLNHSDWRGLWCKKALIMLITSWTRFYFNGILIWTNSGRQLKFWIIAFLQTEKSWVRYVSVPRLPTLLIVPNSGTCNTRKLITETLFSLLCKQPLTFRTIIENIKEWGMLLRWLVSCNLV